MSVEPDIDESYVVYSRKDSQGNWRAEGYWITAKESVFIAGGENTKKAQIKGREIFLGKGAGTLSRYDKTIDSMFFEKLNPLPAVDPANPTIEDIKAEIEKLTSQKEEVAVRGVSTNSAELSTQNTQEASPSADFEPKEATTEAQLK
jgi:hypothetical protein